jgi:hypothetical protein
MNWIPSLSSSAAAEFEEKYNKMKRMLKEKESEIQKMEERAKKHKKYLKKHKIKTETDDESRSEVRRILLIEIL